MEAVNTGSNPWNNLSLEERARQIAQKEEERKICYSSSGDKTSFSILKDDVGEGIGKLRRGIPNIFKGIFETTSVWQKRLMPWL